MVLHRFIHKTHLPYPQTRPNFGPFNSTTQRRWKKPSTTAQTRLEDRTLDLKLDTLMTHHRKLTIILRLIDLMTHRRRGPFISVQTMSRWTHIVNLNVPIGKFLNKYPHVFDVMPHPVKKNISCKVNPKFTTLLQEECKTVKDMELDNVNKLKKMLMMSVTGTLHIHALRLIKRELGLPDDFRESILAMYDDFELVDLEIVRLVEKDEGWLKVAEVEKWRENEYKEKWLSEFEIRYAFPISFPTGFKIKAGFRGELKEWQRLSYSKPYEKEVRFKGVKRLEKRAVGILHEVLSLTVEKRVEVERLVHFKKDFGVVVNFREVILKHPGIFYICTRGCTQVVFLREAYCGDVLFCSNPIYDVRRKMLDLVLLGERNTRRERRVEESDDDDDDDVDDDDDYDDVVDDDYDHDHDDVGDVDGDADVVVGDANVVVGDANVVVVGDADIDDNDDDADGGVVSDFVVSIFEKVFENDNETSEDSEDDDNDNQTSENGGVDKDNDNRTSENREDEYNDNWTSENRVEDDSDDTDD